MQEWRSIASETTTFFITATITEWQPLFAEQQAKAILLEEFDFYRNKYNSKILAYVIMLEHYHLVAQFQQASDLHGWLHDVQSHTANELSKWLRRRTKSPTELEVYAKHANGPAKLAVWKEQARVFGITSEKTLLTKIDYTHKNPVTRGLASGPGDWLWSSWRNYYLDDDSVFRIDRMELL